MPTDIYEAFFVKKKQVINGCPLEVLEVLTSLDVELPCDIRQDAAGEGPHVLGQVVLLGICQLCAAIPCCFSRGCHQSLDVLEGPIELIGSLEILSGKLGEHADRVEVCP